MPHDSTDPAPTTKTTTSADIEAIKSTMMAPDAQKVIDSIVPKFSSKEEEREYLKHRLAQAFRIFGHLGYDEGVAGHITVRDPIDKGTFWVNPFGRHFGSIRARDLLHVDHHGKILPDSGPQRVLNRAAFMIHSEVHKARPEVDCAAHSHSVYGRAFATLGIELDMLTQDACAFYKDHVVYRSYKGVVLDEEEGIAIAAALGGAKAAILQNHGLLVATPTIEATVHFYIALEKSCQVQLLADAAAKGRGGVTVKVDEEDAKNTWTTVGQSAGAYFSGLPHFQALERREALLPQELKMDDPKWLKAL